MYETRQETSLKGSSQHDFRAGCGCHTQDPDQDFPASAPLTFRAELSLPRRLSMHTTAVRPRALHTRQPPHLPTPLVVTIRHNCPRGNESLIWPGTPRTTRQTLYSSKAWEDFIRRQKNRLTLKTYNPFLDCLPPHLCDTTGGGGSLLRAHEDTWPRWYNCFLRLSSGKGTNLQQLPHRKTTQHITAPGSR